jgi:hypothetical protein
MMWLIIPLIAVAGFATIYGLFIFALAPFIGWPWTPEPLYWYGQTISALDTPPGTRAKL